MHRFRCLALTAAALLSGCADFGGPISGEGGQAPPSPEEVRMQNLEQRLADIGRRLENLNLAAMSQDNARLEADVRAMRGEVERLSYLVESSEKRSKELYQDLDRRMQQLENSQRSARLTMDSSMPNAPPVAANASPEEESTYRQVFDQLKGGRYDDAIAGFRGMIERWPTGRYADNAWYWLGASYSEKRDFNSAQAAFQSLLTGFPQSPKRADAMYKLAAAQIELGNKEDARATLERLVTEHPKSNAATLAQQRLQQLK